MKSVTTDEPNGHTAVSSSFAKKLNRLALCAVVSKQLVEHRNIAMFFSWWRSRKWCSYSGNLLAPRVGITASCTSPVFSSMHTPPTRFKNTPSTSILGARCFLSGRMKASYLRDAVKWYRQLLCFAVDCGLSPL